MDPNEALDRIRNLIRMDDVMPLDRDDVGTFIELVQSLDEWITKGGFLPSDWQEVE
jgi:hypothetical protein